MHRPVQKVTKKHTLLEARFSLCTLSRRIKHWKYQLAVVFLLQFGDLSTETVLVPKRPCRILKPESCSSVHLASK